MSARNAPLLEAPAWVIMGGLALAILVVYALGRNRKSVWPAILLRIFAAAGIIVPGMTILSWYQQLNQAREWSHDLPIHTEPIVELFIIDSAALLSVGFFVLISGIYLARRLPGRPGRSGPDSEAER